MGCKWVGLYEKMYVWIGIVMRRSWTNYQHEELTNVKNELKVNQRWINYEGGWLIIVNVKVKMVIKNHI
jgi:hypothetical protein